MPPPGVGTHGERRIDGVGGCGRRVRSREGGARGRLREVGVQSERLRGGGLRCERSAIDACVRRNGQGGRAELALRRAVEAEFVRGPRGDVHGSRIRHRGQANVPGRERSRRARPESRSGRGGRVQGRAAAQRPRHPRLERRRRIRQDLLREGHRAHRGVRHRVVPRGGDDQRGFAGDQARDRFGGGGEEYTLVSHAGGDRHGLRFAVH
mmetsp:Transcript_39739/g.85685  ORF Transcript_39739/g.85685 Transcript_39739/m.85685 type:complete len:209 (+) Transcript_39739:1384-2010(+)